MIMITIPQAPRDQRSVRRAETAAEDSAKRTLEYASEYVFATVNGRYEVRVVRRAAGAWAVRLRGFALHRDGCFWPVPDDATPGKATPDRTVPGRTCRRGEPTYPPTYPLDQAIARTLQALVRLP